MSTSAPQQALQDTMTRLEAALLAPVVSGELPAWVGSVEEAASTFAVDWTRQLHSVQHVQYREIAESDPELLAEVEKMIAADEELLESFARFHEQLHGFRKEADKIGWQETKLAGRRKQLEESGTQLVLNIKKQQAAAGTWLTEALYRDRGVMD
jgi:hypothetical protein